MKTMGFKLLVVILMILIYGCASPGFSQSVKTGRLGTAADKEGKEDGAIAAVVNGTLVITQKELDEAIGPQLYSLQEKIHKLRKKALEGLLVQVVLKGEAEKRGITVEELKRQLMPNIVEVKPNDIDERYADNLGTLENMNEDEAKQRIKLDLESRLKLDAYHAGVSEILGRANIETLLSEPVPPSAVINAEGPTRGPADAPVTILEFSDFQCPYCKQAALTLKALMQNYGSNVKLVFKQMPLSIHPDAFKAAQASVCADEQGKFWEYHDTLFDSSDISEPAIKKYASRLGLRMDEFKICMDSPASAATVRRDMQQAARADVQGTPTFFVNGKLIRGINGLEAFRNVVDQALSQSRQEGKYRPAR